MSQNSSSNLSTTTEMNYSQSIFRYSDYRLFLKDFFKTEKEKKSKISLRYIAQKAGFSSHSFFDKVLKGERNLSLESTLKLAKVIGLGPKATQFFQELVLYSQAQSIREKEERFANLNKLRVGTNFYKIQESQHAYFTAWYYQVIKELVVYGKWNGDYAKLGRMLRPAISEAKAKQAVDKLLEIGIIEKRAGDKFKSVENVVSGEGVPPSIIHKTRTELLLKSFNAAEILPKSERHISYSTITLSQEKYEEVCRHIDEFRQKILSLAIKDEKPNKVWSLQFHLFPLTEDMTQS